MNETKFSIEKRNSGEIATIGISGYLDAHTAPILEKELSTTIDSGTNKIIVNFENLDYISSAGLGVFMAFIEDVRNSGGDIKMSDMNEKVYSVFDLLGFPLLFDIELKEADAFNKFSSLNPPIDE